MPSGSTFSALTVDGLWWATSPSGQTPVKADLTPQGVLRGGAQGQSHTHTHPSCAPLVNDLQQAVA